MQSTSYKEYPRIFKLCKYVRLVPPVSNTIFFINLSLLEFFESITSYTLIKKPKPCSASDFDVNNLVNSIKSRK